MSKKVLITGGTGLVGKALIELLHAKGYQVAVLSRSAKAMSKATAYTWDIAKEYIDPLAFEGTEVIIHLAGAGVAEKRWTADRKEEIYNSRTKSSLLLYNHLKNNPHQVNTFVAASAIGLYGMDTGSAIIKENAPTGSDFLAHVTDAWEASTRKIATLGIRLVQTRIGIVLSNEGGALKELLKPPLAAPLGNGQQYMSWIHIKDLCNQIIFAIENKQVIGPINAVGPKPMSNREFTKLAARVFKKPYLPIPVPKLVLKLMLGEMAQIVLGGNRVSAEKIMTTGFQFEFSKLNAALKDLKKG